MTTRRLRPFRPGSAIRSFKGRRHRRRTRTGAAAARPTPASSCHRASIAPTTQTVIGFVASRSRRRPVTTGARSTRPSRPAGARHGVTRILTSSRLRAGPSRQAAPTPAARLAELGTSPICDRDRNALRRRRRCPGGLTSFPSGTSQTSTATLYPQDPDMYRSMVNAVAASVHAVNPNISWSPGSSRRSSTPPQRRTRTR